MAPESWIVLVSAAAMFLVGVACSPLAWAAQRQRRSRFEEHILGRLALLSRRLEELEGRANTEAKRAPASDESRKRAVAKGAEPSLLITIPSLESTTGDRKAVAEGLAERYSSVWRLAESGRSAEEISRETQTPIGQIELILGLRRSLQSSRTTFSHPGHPTPGREPS